MIKAIFFDNDGILHNSEELILECNNEIGKSFGISQTTEEFTEYVMIKGGGTEEFLQDRGFSEDQIKDFYAQRSIIWDEKLFLGKLAYPGVVETLQKLQPNYIMGLTTSAYKDKFDIMSRDTNLIQYFDFALFRHDCKAIKPDPDIYLQALEKAGVVPEEAIVIEDTPRGIAAGKAAGIRVITIPNDLTKNLDLSQADFCIDNITELPDLISTLS